MHVLAKSDKDAVDIASQDYGTLWSDIDADGGDVWAVPADLEELHPEYDLVWDDEDQIYLSKEEL
jgi:hypothetical protein